jgi:hypothetical protein
MAMRIYRRRRRFPIRPRRRTQWARVSLNNVGPVHGPSVNADDLLANWRTAAGVTLNIPEFTIARIHIKISIAFSWSPATITANSLAHFALTVDSINQAPLNPLTNQYQQSYMMWDAIYGTEQLFQGGGDLTTLGDSVLYRTIDIRSKRKLGNAGDTLWALLVDQGNLSMSGYSYTGSILLQM